MPVTGSRSVPVLGRALSWSLVGVVSASVLLPAVASAATVTARDISSACPPGDVPRAGFVDTVGTTFEAEIDCVAGYGIARGTSRTTFEPTRQVTRGQMASFLANTLVAAGRTRPSTLPDAFRDDDGSAHEANIDWLAREGVVGGFADGTYRPGVAVTRAQVATFLNNLLREVTGSRLASTTDHFRDDDTSPHEANIDGLASRGIVAGTGTGTYAPGRAVTRQQMAGFLAREVDFLVDEGHVDLPFGVRAIVVEPTSAARLDTSDNGASATADRGRRTYTVTVPIGVERVHLALFPADQVTVAADGTPRFASNALVPADAGTGIEVVDGRTVDLAGGSTDVVRITDRQVRDEQLSFVVDSVVPHAVVPVVWQDTIDPAQDRLDLETGAGAGTPKPAREPVAVGGAVTWGPVEPAKGTNLATGTVRDVNLAAGWYTLDTQGSTAADHLLRFTSGDGYGYTASGEPKAGSPGPITHSQFQAWIGVGDRVDPGPYDPGRGHHAIVGDVPAAPTGVVATVQQDGKVRVTFSKPTNPVADDTASSFRLQRALVTGGTAGTFAEVAARTGDLAAEFLDAPTTAGTWLYRVLARSVTGTSPASATAQVTVSAPPPATTASSVSRDTSARNTAGANGLLDHGDELQFVFDRTVTVSGSWQLLLVDGDGTQGRLHNAVASIAVSGSGGNVVTVTVASNGPAAVSGAAGSTPGVGIGSGGFLQVVTATGFAAPSGSWNLPRSGLEGSPWNNTRVVVGRTSAGYAAPTGLSVTAATRTLEAGRDEVQSISATDADGGTWAVSLGTGGGAPKTADLPLTTTAAELQTALEGLAGIGAGNVLVTGGPLSSAAFTVTFRAGLSATDVAQLTVDPDNLTVSSGTVTGAVATTIVPGVSVAGTIVAGETVAVYTVAGQAVGAATAGANGRTTVTVTAASVGQPFYVVVERPSGHRSRTAIVTAG